jgi:hypothetical protein
MLFFILGTAAKALILEWAHLIGPGYSDNSASIDRPEKYPT